MAMTVSSMVNSGINYSMFLTGTSSNQNATQKTIANLWSSYNSANSNATSTAANLQEVRTNAAALVASYDEAKNTFYNEFDANMNDLAESAQAVRDFDFKGVTAEPKPVDTNAFSAASRVVQAATEAADKSAGEAQGIAQDEKPKINTDAFSAAAKVVEAANKNSDAPQVVRSDFGVTVVSPEQSERVVNSDGSVTTTNADGSKTTSIGNGAIQKTEFYDSIGNKHVETAYSKVMQSALSTIQDFVDNYNGSLQFFQENGEVSTRVNRMAGVFGDATYNAKTYESIGITVNVDGSLGMDAEKVAQAIVDNPSRVSSIMGDGLASNAERHVDVANGQRSQLFPSAQDMFGDELSTASFYTSGAYINLNAYSSLGNLVNMMF